MQPSASIILDTAHPDRPSLRLTTFLVTMHRFVLAEFNTHRTFCLAGDARLEFDLPSGSHKGGRRAYTMSIAEFVDKWHNGANRIGANPKHKADLSSVQDDVIYTAPELAEISGFASAMNINAACRSGELQGLQFSHRGRWYIIGADYKNWRTAVPEHTRYGMRDRLAAMHIRQLDETTGKITTANVVNCIESGTKEVFEVTAGSFNVAGSADHLVMTDTGYVRIGDLVPGVSQIVVRRFGKVDAEKLDPNRLRKFDGVWRSTVQRQLVQAHITNGGTCAVCDAPDNLEAHHVVPVYEDASLALDPANITILCQDCHKDQHHVQGWQGQLYLYGDLVTVDSVAFRGLEPTYDLEISGDYPNFLANGVVVHNSRNSASSRAIPLNKQIDRIISSPAHPIEWPSEIRGMQGGAPLPPEEREAAQAIWQQAENDAIAYAHNLGALGLHKSVTNRLLEPFMWHHVIVSSTEWQNFFDLRCSRLAQPEIRVVAELMRDEYERSVPVERKGWHLPFVDGYDLEHIHSTYEDVLAEQVAVRCSAARCARVSYLTHDQETPDIRKDLELAYRLANPEPGSPMHASPFEHVAHPVDIDQSTILGNFDGFRQFRHLLESDAAERSWKLA